MSKTRFTPFANEADVLHIGGLAVENRVDRVSLHGDVDLTRDQAGLAHARALHKLLGEVLARLEGEDLPASLPAPKVKKVANPFE
jgi:hypothetical protein